MKQQIFNIRKKIALIGCGIWGQKILRDLKKLNCCVFVFDINMSNYPSAKLIGADDFVVGLPKENNFDGIIIASPSTTHRSILEYVISFQIPVFVEKPLTTSYEDALALKSIVHDKVFLMHVWLYHSGIQMLRDIGQSGELGKVLGIRSTRSNWSSPRKDVNSIWNLAPHDITIAKAILGFIPKPRCAVVENHQSIARGMVAILGHDPFCVFEVSNRYERKIREVRLHCEGGIVLLRDEMVDFVEIVRGDSQTSPKKMTVEKCYFDKTPALFSELEEFLNYLTGGKEPRSNFLEGLEVVKTIDQLIKLSV